MRTLAPIRVRRCVPGIDECTWGDAHFLAVCRICGAERYAGRGGIARGVALGLKHLRGDHPWPWTVAQVDTNVE